MIRCAFNGGELSPTSAVRADLDNFHRGSSRIENLDLGQMGGVSRRRGFRRVAAALEGSVILPPIYRARALLRGALVFIVPPFRPPPLQDQKSQRIFWHLSDLAGGPAKTAGRLPRWLSAFGDCCKVAGRRRPWCCHR